MSTVEAFEWVCEMEASADLLRYQIDGWCVWPLLRKGAAAELSCTRPARARQRGVHLRSAVRDLFALPGLRHRRILAKTAISLLMEKVGERYKNVLLDDLLIDAGDFLKIDLINSPAFQAKSRASLVPAALSNSLPDLSAGVTARMVPAPGGRVAALAIAEQMKTWLGIDRDPAVIERQFRRFYWLTRYYRLLLRRVRPQIVIVSTVGEHALCAAAREENIPIVELQHGIVDRHNAGYAWTRYAAPYSRAMPLPDYFFLFGEHWRNELAGSGVWDDRLRVVGSTRIDEYRGRIAGDDRSARTDIVWTTQGVDVSRSIRFMAEFMGKLRDRDVTLRIMLHPLYDADPTPYRSAFQNDPRVVIEVGSSDSSTFEALSKARLHVSIYSASHYDALGLGVPSVVLPFQNHEIVDSLVQAGHATIVNSPAEFCDLLERGAFPAPDPAVSEYYFRKGARPAILDEISRIQGNGRYSDEYAGAGSAVSA